MVDGGVCKRKKVPIDLKGLWRLGIDENALWKGHRDFGAVLSDLNTHSLIDMASSRTHRDIEAVLKPLGADVLGNI